MFKVNNKDTRTWFTPFANVFIAKFEQVFVCWVESLSITDVNRSGATSYLAYLFAIKQKKLKNCSGDEVEIWCGKR